MELLNFHYPQTFELESGEKLDAIDIAYQTFGTLNSSKSNVVWVCHALTANSNVFEWWPGLFGENDLFNPKDYFIVCANNLGSCYGTTGPVNVKDETKSKYRDFPFITIRDMVKAHELLREHLKITQIHTIIGGSQGGQQILEWNVLSPNLFNNTILLATNAKHSAWGIAFNESQRMAIAADSTFYDDHAGGGKKGLSAARSIALLSYRNYQPYGKTQSEANNEIMNKFKASAYQNYQGEKLVKRFNVYAYITLLNAMDSHNVGRGRTSIADALNKIKAQTLIISISNDLLFPPSEQEFLHHHIKQSKWETIHSDYGHDGFLLETNKITKIIKQFYQTA